MTGVSLIPAARAIFIAFLLDQLNKHPHKNDFGPGSPLPIELAIVQTGKRRRRVIQES